MIRVTEIVLDLLTSSSTAIEAMREGILNLSAYAESIHAQVEKKAFKPVKKATIVVTLSRIAKTLDEVPALRPKIYFDELNIKSPLVDVTYDKTKISSDTVRSLSQEISGASFLTFTEGINEVTIIASEDVAEKIISHFRTQPKAIFYDLVAVNVKFSEKYIAEPNIIYAVLEIVATKRINIKEIVSTYTELTIIIERKDLEKTMQVFHTFLPSKND